MAISPQCRSEGKFAGRGEAGMWGEEEVQHVEPKDLPNKITVSVKQQLQNPSKLKKAGWGHLSDGKRNNFVRHLLQSVVPWITEL